MEKAKENFLVAAKMGFVAAMKLYGELLDATDPQRWHWWGIAAARERPFNFLVGFPDPVIRFESDPFLAPIVFLIDRALITKRRNKSLETMAILTSGSAQQIVQSISSPLSALLLAKQSIFGV